MQHSDQINELATALAKAQGEIEIAVKDSENPHFKSRYADLQSCWAACRDPLTKHGLAVVQSPSHEDGVAHVTTLLTHSSGQWMRSDCSVRPNKPDAQGLGSALTYLRRYALSAMVGIAPGDDDDGNAASADQGGVKTPTKPKTEPLKADDVKVPNEFWQGTSYKLTAPNMTAFAEKIIAYMREAGSLDALDVLAEDNEKNLERMREGAPDLYLRVSEESNTARSVFLNEPKNEPKEAE